MCGTALFHFDYSINRKPPTCGPATEHVIMPAIEVFLMFDPKDRIFHERTVGKTKVRTFEAGPI